MIDERKTRSVPDQTDAERKFKYLYGTDTMNESGSTDSAVASTLAEAYTTMQSLLDNSQEYDPGDMAGNFGYPFPGQSGSSEGGRRLLDGWMEQVEAWQQLLQTMMQSYTSFSGDTSWPQSFDYASLFTPDRNDEPPKSQSATVIVANSDRVDAEVVWKGEVPSVPVKAQGPFIIGSEASLDNVNVSFQLSIDGKSQVMMVTIAEGTSPGTYAGVVHDESGTDYGYLTVTVA
jgi:hypothetical protein